MRRAHPPAGPSFQQWDLKDPAAMQIPKTNAAQRCGAKDLPAGKKDEKIMRIKGVEGIP
jgi:hypothetical protein